MKGLWILLGEGKLEVLVVVVVWVLVPGVNGNGKLKLRLSGDEWSDPQHQTPQCKDSRGVILGG